MDKPGSAYYKGEKGHFSAHHLLFLSFAKVVHNDTSTKVMIFPYCEWMSCSPGLKSSYTLTDIVSID